MAVIVNGDELYKKAQDLLVNPTSKDPYVDYEKAFHWFNVLLNGAYENNDKGLAALYFAVGSTSLKRGHYMLAMLCCHKVIEIDPDFLEAHNNLGYVYKKFGKEEEAKYYFKHVVEAAEQRESRSEEFIKELANFYANYGSMFVGRGIPDEALAIFNKGMSYNPDDEMLKYNRSLAYLEKGDYEKGFVDWDLGERVERVGNRNYGRDNLPWWDGTPGKKLVVIGEQGIGDEIMYATLLPKLMKDCGVVFDFHPRLVELFRRSFPDVDIYGTRKDQSDIWGTRYQFDAKVMLGSLPRFYCKSEDDFLPSAYLKADPVLVEKYREKLEALGGRPKIGISWRGGSIHHNRRHIPMEKLVGILKMPADFISLQYDKNIDDMVATFEKEHGVSLNHWPDVLDDYDETAGLVANLDLVISVPQSVVHLAGALGVMTIQMTPKAAMWQMGPYGKNMPWYDCVSSVWQDDFDDWDSVVKKIEGQLCSLLQTSTAA